MTAVPVFLSNRNNCNPTKNINNINVKKPAGITKKILEESLKNNNMEAFDDCTVMVLGVFDTYVNV